LLCGLLFVVCVFIFADKPKKENRTGVKDIYEQYTPLFGFSSSLYFA
jgi:hypothetical protein